MADRVPPRRGSVSRRHLLFGAALAVWLAVLALVAGTSLRRLPAPSWGNPAGESLSAEIAGATRVGQAFTAPLPGLSGLRLTLDRASAGGARQIILHLKDDSQAGAGVLTREFWTSEVPGAVSYRFDMAPLRNSAGRTYTMILESPTSQAGDAVAARYSPTSALQGSGAMLDGQRLAGDLQFQAVFTLTTPQKVDLLLTRMAQGRPHLLGWKGFYVGVALAYALALGTFLWQVARSLVDDRGGTA